MYSRLVGGSRYEVNEFNMIIYLGKGTVYNYVEKLLFLCET